MAAGRVTLAGHIFLMPMLKSKKVSACLGLGTKARVLKLF